MSCGEIWIHWWQRALKMGKPIKVEMPNQIQSSVVVTVSETRIRGVSYS